METANEDQSTEGFEVVTDDTVAVPEAEAKPDPAPEAKPEEKPEPEAKADASQDSEAKPDGEGDAKAEPSKAEQAKNESPTDEGANRKQNRVQKRIDKLTKQKADLERENAKLKANAEKGKQEKPDAQGKEPQAADYDDYNEYLSDLAAFNESQDSGEQSDKAKKEPEKPEAPEVSEEFTEALDDVMSAFKDAKADYSDFDDVVHSKELKITEDMVIALSETDDPAAIAYHLGKHTDEASKIAAMSPRQQMRAIAKLEAKVSDKKPPSKKTTNAGDPIDPVSGGGEPAKDLETASFSDYEKQRNEQERGKGGKSFW